MIALGIDVGTTAVKVVALDPGGRTVAEASAAHDLLSLRPSWAKTDPHAWWTGVVAALRQLGQTGPLASVAIAGVGGLVPALVPIDAGGRVLRKAMLYNDARTGAEVAWLAERIDRGAFFTATHGRRLLARFPGITRQVSRRTARSFQRPTLSRPRSQRRHDSWARAERFGTPPGY